jgi:hypothetical protein
MKILASANAIEQEFGRLMHSGAVLSGAVAWASAGFPLAEMVLERREQVKRLVVGLHFYQTDPEFIRRALSTDKIRYMMSTRGVFHPKLFLFDCIDGSWTCIIGSSNFTAGGFSTNVEVSVAVTSDDLGAAEMRSQVDANLDEYWKGARQMSPDELAGYNAMWAARRPILKRLGGGYGKPRRSNEDDGGDPPVVIPVLRQTWSQFFAAVSKDGLLADREVVLRSMGEWFDTYDSFEAMPPLLRKRIGGFITEAGQPDYLLFGSMRGAGTFKHLINRNHHGISDALACVPREGAVTSVDYFGFMERFRHAFNGVRGGSDTAIATATRLLAMKRPDYFVCIDSKNRQKLCSAFGIPQAVRLSDYWGSVCERIYDSAWWNVSLPDDVREREVWKGRAALLDSLYYVPGAAPGN